MAKESGLYQKWIDEAINAKGGSFVRMLEDNKEAMFSANVLVLDDLFDQFYLLLLGVILAIILLIFEVGMKRSFYQRDKRSITWG